jgi:hypothetical protein
MKMLLFDSQSFLKSFNLFWLLFATHKNKTSKDSKAKRLSKLLLLKVTNNGSL